MAINELLCRFCGQVESAHYRYGWKTICPPDSGAFTTAPNLPQFMKLPGREEVGDVNYQAKVMQLKTRTLPPYVAGEIVWVSRDEVLELLGSER